MSYGNTFGRTSESFAGGKRIWHDVFHSFPVGGKISNLASFSAGTVIPAGSMCIWSKVEDGGYEVKIVKSTDTDDLASVNGLLRNDVYVTDGVTYATATVVYAGAIYSDRLADTIPASVWALLPEIKQIKEA